MAGIGIIANPHSKLNKRNPERPKLLSYIAGERGQLEITQNLEQLKDVATDFKKKNIDILAINGGDGTISQTLSAFIKIYETQPLPQIAVLGGGTMNMLAKNLNISGSPQEILTRLIQVYSSQVPVNEKTIPSLKVEENYGFLFASGTSAHFLREFYKNKTGALGAISLVLKLSFSILSKGDLHKNIVQSEQVSIESPGSGPLAHQSLSVLASTVVKVPLGLPYFTQLRHSDHKIQYSSVTMSTSEIAYKLPRLIFNRGNPKFELTATCNHFSFQSQSKIFYTIDGELYQSDSNNLKISLGPEIRFIQLMR